MFGQMPRWAKVWLCVPVLMMLNQIAAAALQSENEDQDKTLSPYFQVLSQDSQTDSLPLKSTRADVNVSGVIAQVKVTQVYKNEGKTKLEAIYVFPASTRAAVYAMKMTIGERVIEAKINEREQARKDYEKALSEGKTASLLEQQRPNVFQMNVGNILPGDVIKVEMFYTELLVPEDNTYEFVYPTVAGTRYSNMKESGAPDTESWVKNPYMHAGAASPFTFGLDVTVNSGMPIAKISSPSHPDVKVEYTGKQTAHITVPESAKAGNRDFMLKYSLAGDKIESGLLLYPGKDENFFLMMMEPPKRVETKLIVPREYIFIIDVSGSMYGFPLDTTKALMKDLFSQLRPSDYFNVLLFSGNNSIMSEQSLPASKENIQKALDTIDHQQGGGGTELMPALKRALALPRAEGTSRNVIIATDGYVSVEKEAFEYIRSHLGQANFFSFGIGSSVNRFLMEGMARAGMGEPFIVLNPQKAPEQAAKLKAYIASPVLTGIKVKFEGLNAYDVEPMAVPDLFAQKSVVVFGKYKGTPSGAIRVIGLAAGEKYENVMHLKDAQASAGNEAIRYMWARHRIMLLSDMNKLDKSDARVKEVTQLGLKYNLMTEYTSFVAIDSLVRTDGSKGTQVKQPLPMPEGVSDYAVGGGYNAGPAGMVCRSAAAPMMAECKKADYEEKDEAVVQPKPQEKVKPQAPQVRAKLLNAAGGLSGTEVEKVLLHNLEALKQEYRRELAQKEDLSGTLTLEFTISAEGIVSGVKITRDQLQWTALSDRVIKLVEAWVFAKPQTNKPTAVKCEIRFDLK
jgi:Ca-activated chloride channel family protein